MFKNKIAYKISAVAISLLISGNAFALETKAKQAILMDFDTGEYILKKEYDKKMAPASMSKLMTIYMVFERLKDGRLSLDDKFTVSENAWRKGGTVSGSSTMFLNPNSKVRVEDLIQGIVIQSGNDACITVAENISGSEEDFADEMNKKAYELGLKDSSFANSTGWPDENQKMSPKDLAKLAKILITEFPDYYHFFSEKKFTYNGITQGNRNPLLYRMRYADGLKTGHTQKSGHGLVGSAKKNGRRLIMVINGLDTLKERASESERVMRWGFREFENYTFFAEAEKVADIKVWMGNKKEIPLVVNKDVKLTIQKNKLSNVKLSVTHKTPIAAPIKKGQKLAELNIKMATGDVRKFDLVAGEDVNKLGFFGKIIPSIKYLLFGVK
jgi:D-alanyl-D-alanine carboxypeptidase (penicillin-binding protein 5/6)